MWRSHRPLGIAIIEIAKTNEKEAIEQANTMVKAMLNY
jgi:hypothetical protein